MRLRGIFGLLALVFACGELIFTSQALGRGAQTSFQSEHGGQLVFVTIKDVPESDTESSAVRRVFGQGERSSLRRVPSDPYKIDRIDIDPSSSRVLVRARDKGGEEKTCEIPFAALSPSAGRAEALRGSSCNEGGKREDVVDPETVKMLLLIQDLPNYLKYRITCDIAESGGQPIGYGIFAQPCSSSQFSDCPDLDSQRALFNRLWTPSPQAYPLVLPQSAPSPAFPELAKLWESLGPLAMILAVTAAQENDARRSDR